MPVYGTTTLHRLRAAVDPPADYDLSLSPAPSLLITLASLVFRPPIGRGRARRPGEEPAVMKLNILLLRNEPEGRAARCSLSLTLQVDGIICFVFRLPEQSLSGEITHADSRCVFERVAVYFIFLISTHKGTCDVKV